MPKEESEKGGLLSKVVKFVRGSGTEWSDSEQKPVSGEQGYSKQLLKDMIERKRRNDFVRRREFEILRKVRRREPLSHVEQGQNPSFFQSSMPSQADARALTLKKIDEIEAQMSLQWWKKKNNNESPPSESEENSFRNTAPVQMQDPSPLGLQAAPKARAGTADDSLKGPPTTAHDDTDTLPPPQPSSRRVLQNQPAHHLMGGLVAGYEGDSSSFSPSKLYAVEVAEVAHDAELEEAAIRFANGDVKGAENSLQETLRPGASRVDYQETWLALFDLYRATGQRDAFDHLAMDFAVRFSRSAPNWFLVASDADTLSTLPSLVGAQAQMDWTSPSLVDHYAAEALHAKASSADGRIRLSMDWSLIQGIDAAALPVLRRVFGNWATHTTRLQFMGCEALERVLKSLAPSGNKEVDPQWWRLRMDTMRIWHRPDEFELLALDYCVTYEVSPPSWERALCSFKSLDLDSGSLTPSTMIGGYPRETSAATVGFGDTQPMSDHALAPSPQNVINLELTGLVRGDISAMLSTVETEPSLAQAQNIVISCRRLIRVDFSAAGVLLNWVSNQQAQGRVVQFADAHRLVAAFLHVIGINEHALISILKD